MNDVLNSLWLSLVTEMAKRWASFILVNKNYKDMIFLLNLLLADSTYKMLGFHQAVLVTLQYQ